LSSDEIPSCYGNAFPSGCRNRRRETQPGAPFSPLFCRQIPKDGVKPLNDESFLGSVAFFESADQMPDCLLTAG